MENQKHSVKKRIYILFSLIGSLFFFFSFTGGQLAQEGNIVWTTKYFLILMCMCIVLGSILGISICMLFVMIGRKRAGHVYGEPAIFKSLHGGKCFMFSWILIVLSWFPGYLAYYPGICAYDIPPQLEQILLKSFNEHHPVAHTLLLKGFYFLGKNIFGSANSGIAVFAFLQMLMLGAVFALGIAMLRSFGARWGWIIGLLLYGMFFPIHMYMSISITKDIIFTIFLLIQIFALYKMISNMVDEFKIGKWDIIFLVSTIGMILFRGNGRYALLVLIAFALMAVLFSKKRRFFGKILLNSVMGFVLGSILLSALFQLTHAQPGDKREMLSMPIQQFSRTMLYHGGIGILPEDDNTMNHIDKALINDFILNEGYKGYRGDISDPVKGNTNTYVVRYRPKDFIATYLHLLGQYPGDFLNAAMAVNAGYLYPGDTSHAYININGVERGLGYIQTRWGKDALASIGGVEIYKDSKWEWLHERLESYADSNSYLSVPILKYIFVPGTYLWIYLFLAAYLVLHKKYRLLFPLALILGYYITLFLGPAVQLRYLYPVMTALPFIIGWCVTFIKNCKNEEV